MSRLRRELARLGRALDPEAASHRRALRALLEEWRSRDEERAAAEAARLEALAREVALVGRDAEWSQRQLKRLRQSFDRQRSLLSKFVSHAQVDRRAVEAEHRVTSRLARLARSPLPIVVGPWTGEVGFELLYWIPFLQWVRDTYPIDPSRLIVLSRGGVGAWYGHVSREYEEVFSLASVSEFHDATTTRKKQKRIRPFDRMLVRQVMRARRLRRAHLLHPTLMYAMYNAFWRYTATVRQLESHARYRRLPPVDVPAGLLPPLPDRFVAVRFYFSDCFPDTPDNRAFAARTIDGLAARSDVVLLNSDLVVDDHRDFAPALSARVHLLSTHMHPETNLAVQTAAIGRASAFVGTYGGYSYLAPLYGVPSVAFYSRQSFKQHHLELAHRAFQRLGPARLMPVDVRQADWLAGALAGFGPVSAQP